MNPIPGPVTLIFIGAACWTLFGVYKASHHAKTYLYVALLWLLVQSALALSGFYTRPGGMPVGKLFLSFPPIVLIIVMLFSGKGRKFMEEMDLGWCLIIHIIRIPVEVALFLLYQHKLVPIRMTFEGGNLDIVSGISVIIIWLLYRQDKLNKFLLAGWNVLCVLLLINILWRGNYPPHPLNPQAGGTHTPALAYFPVNLLPSFIAPTMLFMHVAIFVKLAVNWRASVQPAF